MGLRARQAMTDLVRRAVTQRGAGRDFPYPACENPLRGRPVPEAYMPGRMIMWLDEATREVLRGLTSDDLSNRRPIPWA